MQYFDPSTPAGRAVSLAYELASRGRISSVEAEAFIAPLKDIADAEAKQAESATKAQTEAEHQTRQ